MAKPKDATETRQVSPGDYLGRMRLNLNELVGFYEQNGETRSDLAAHCGLGGHQTLNNMLGGKHPGTRVDHVVSVAAYLGVSPARLFMTVEEFRASLVTDPPSPLPAAPRLRSLDSSGYGLTQSETRDVDRGQFGRNAAAPKKRRGSARTSPSDASNRCFMHTRRDQRRWVRASRGTYRNGTYSVHQLRPARTPVRVTSTNDPRQVA